MAWFGSVTQVLGFVPCTLEYGRAKYSKCMGKAVNYKRAGTLHLLSADCCMILKKTAKECVPNWLNFMNPLKLIKDRCSEFEAFRKE